MDGQTEKAHNAVYLDGRIITVHCNLWYSRDTH